MQNVDEVCIDEKNKLVSAPAYMYNGQFHQIQDSVTKMVGELFKMMG